LLLAFQNYENALMIAKGTVEAGIDLNQMDPSDVKISEDGKEISVKLPPVIILNRDYILSNDQDTRVYRPKDGLFANTKGRETELRHKANQELLKSACEAGIMDRATKFSKIAIEQLLNTTLPGVDINVESSAMPLCK
jgi:hypothetical protein